MYLSKRTKKFNLLNFNSDNYNTILKYLPQISGSNCLIFNAAHLDNIEDNDDHHINIILIFIEKDNLSNRKLLWILKNKYSDMPLVLCSEDKNMASLAWQIDTLYFLQFPLSRKSLANMNLRIDKSQQLELPKMKFNHQSGFHLIDHADICYCKSDGNYTEIILSNNKKIMVSKKIKDIADKMAVFPNLIRIGKSYLINLDNIRRVDESSIIFKGENAPIKIELSSVYLRRVKEVMLWYSI